MGVDAADAGMRQPTPWRHALVHGLDVVLVVIGAVIAIVLGAPLLGCAIGAGGWVLQRGVALVAAPWLAARRDPTQQVGATFVERFGRIWLLAAAIVVAGVVGGRADGLAAALTIFFAYSVAFAITIASGPPPARGTSA